MILLTTLGSRNYFSQRALIPEDQLLRQKILRISLDFSPRPLCSSALQFPTTIISLWIIKYTRHSYIHSHCSCYYTIPWNTPISRESIVPATLQLHFCLNTSTANSPWLSRICSSLVVHVDHKSLRNTIRSSDNPLLTIALQILLCLHRGYFPYV